MSDILNSLKDRYWSVAVEAQVVYTELARILKAIGVVETVCTGDRFEITTVCLKHSRTLAYFWPSEEPSENHFEDLYELLEWASRPIRNPRLDEIDHQIKALEAERASLEGDFKSNLSPDFRLWRVGDVVSYIGGSRVDLPTDTSYEIEGFSSNNTLKIIDKGGDFRYVLASNFTFVSRPA